MLNIKTLCNQWENVPFDCLCSLVSSLSSEYRLIIMEQKFFLAQLMNGELILPGPPWRSGASWRLLLYCSSCIEEFMINSSFVRERMHFLQSANCFLQLHYFKGAKMLIFATSIQCKYAGTAVHAMQVKLTTWIRMQLYPWNPSST